MKSTIISICLLFISLVFFGQKDDCKQDVIKGYDQLNKMAGNTTSEAIFFKCSIFNRYNGPIEVRKMNYEVISNIQSAKSKMDIGRGVVFHDDSNQVTIKKDTRMVIISNTSDEKLDNTIFSRNMMLRDSLLARAKVHRCENIENSNGSPGKRVVLTMNKTDQKRYRLERMVFEMDDNMSGNNTIKKVVFQYMPGNKIKSVEIIIHKLINNYKGEVFAGSAVNQVLDDKGRLLPAYSGYRLMDVR